MKKIFKFSFLFCFIFLAFFIAKDAFAISGFLPKQIWYSSEKLIEGETVEIHTAVWNGEENTYLLKIGFFDEEELLGERDIALKPGEIRDVFITWKITVGEHIISAKIISSEVVVATGKKESIVLKYNETEEDRQRIAAMRKIEAKKPEEKEKNIASDFVSVANSIIPRGVSEPVAKSYGSVDLFRENTGSKLFDSKNKVKEEIEIIKKNEAENKNDLNKKKNPEDPLKKPFAYIKLIVLGLLSFIFSNKIIFYPLLGFLIFWIVRFSYRKIRNS